MVVAYSQSGFIVETCRSCKLRPIFNVIDVFFRSDTTSSSLPPTPACDGMVRHAYSVIPMRRTVIAKSPHKTGILLAKGL